MAGSDARRETTRDVLLAAMLGVLAFATAVSFDFVYDDRWTIAGNRWLDEPLSGLWAAMANGTAPAQGIPDATRPAMVTSLWLDRRLFGDAPLGFHLHSLLLYGAACAVAALAASALLEDRRAARIAGVFFALAPLHAEVACAANYREDSIAAIGILAPLAWLFRPSSEKDGARAGACISAVFAWGLLGKESAVMLVPLVAAVAAIRRVDRAWLARRERTLYFLGAVFLVWANWRLSLATSDDGIPRAPHHAWLTRFGDTARYELRAVASALLPVWPSPEYDTSPAASFAWFGALCLVAACVVWLAARPRARPYALGLTIALVAPVATSPLVGPVNPWADRYAFVAILGGGLLCGTLGSLLRARRVTSIVVIASALALCTRSALVWKNERRLWTYAVERAPGSPRAWAALSRVERRDGHLDEADRLVSRALALSPDHVPARVTRVYNLLARGNTDAARTEIAAVERLGGRDHPGLPRARFCAGKAAAEARRCAVPPDESLTRIGVPRGLSEGDSLIDR